MEVIGNFRESIYNKEETKMQNILSGRRKEKHVNWIQAFISTHS